MCNASVNTSTECELCSSDGGIIQILITCFAGHFVASQGANYLCNKMHFNVANITNPGRLHHRTKINYYNMWSESSKWVPKINLETTVPNEFLQQ